MPTRLLGLLPKLLALITVLLIAGQLGENSWTTALVLGVIAGNLVELDNDLRGQLRDYVLLLLLFACFSALVQLSLDNYTHFALLFSSLTFVLIYLGTLGARYKTLGFIGLVIGIYTALSYQPGISPWQNPLLLLLGALIQGAYALALEWLLPYRPVREAIANGYLALADYLDAKARFFDPDELDLIAQHRQRLLDCNDAVIQKFNRCREALFFRSANSRYGRYLHQYFTAQNIHERISSSHFNHTVFVYQLRHSDLVFRLQRLLQQQAAACRAVAAGVPLSQRLEKSLTGINEALARLPGENRLQLELLRRLVANLTAVNEQLRSLDRHDGPRDARIHYQQTPLRQLLPLLWQQFDLSNPALRHALRLTLLMVVSFTLIACLQLDLGYWILLTVLFVCQPNYASTRSRVNQRIIGTLAGVLAALAIPLFFPSDSAKMAFVLLTTMLFFYFRQQRYGYSTFFITLQALSGFSLQGLNLYEAIPMRLLDTVIGAGLAWLALRYCWADWHYLRPDLVIGQVRASLAAYLAAVLQRESPDDLAYRVARREAHERLAQLSATVQELRSHGSDSTALQAVQEESWRQLSHISALASHWDGSGALMAQLATPTTANDAPAPEGSASVPASAGAESPAPATTGGSASLAKAPPGPESSQGDASAAAPTPDGSASVPSGSTAPAKAAAPTTPPLGEAVLAALASGTAPPELLAALAARPESFLSTQLQQILREE